MSLRSVFFLLGSILLLISCKTQSSIVTSKYEAEKLGIYKAPPQTKKSRSKTASNQKIENKKETSKQSEINHSTADDIVLSEEYNYIGEQLVNQGYEFLGTPYRSGGTTTAGMDCSGFIIATFKDYNIQLPRSSNEMANIGEEVPMSEAQKGDLIFFKTNGRRVINHVGMVIENYGDYVKFIHSSTSQGVIISTTKEGYYSRTYAKINRVISKT